MNPTEEFLGTSWSRAAHRVQTMCGSTSVYPHRYIDVAASLRRSHVMQRFSKRVLQKIVYRLTNGARLRVAVIVPLCFALIGCTTTSSLNFDSPTSRQWDTGSAPPDGAPNAGGAGATDAPSLPTHRTGADQRHAGTAGVAASNDDERTPSLDTWQVRSAFASLLERWVSCFHRPDRCDPDAVAAAGSPEHDRLRESVAYYATERLRTKPGEGSLVWRLESLNTRGDDSVRLVVCEHDTRIFFDASLADTELGDIILDATIWTRRVEWTRHRIDERWQLWSRRVEQRSPAERFCNV